MASGIIYGDSDKEMAAKRALAVQAALRGAAPMPTEGQMVGNRYVKPHWTQQLGAALDNAMAGYTAGRGVEAEHGKTQRAQSEYEDLIKNRPQAQEVEMAGPQPAELEGQPLMGTKEPTQDQQLDWALKMTRNPLGKALGQKVAENIMIKDPDTEAQHEFKSGESSKLIESRYKLFKQQADARTADLEKKLEATKGKTAAEIASREKIAAALNDARFKNKQVDMEIARMRAAAKGAGGGAKGAAKPVPNTIAKAMFGAEQLADGMDEVVGGFKPEFGGIEGAVDKVSGTWNPFSGKESEESANWWKSYENQAALVERHEKFGTALSAGERQAWRDATISPGMKADVIRKNLELRQRLAAKVYDNTRDSYIKMGYPQIEDAFSRRGAEPAAEQSVASPARRSTDKPAASGGIKKYNPATGRLE